MAALRAAHEVTALGCATTRQMYESPAESAGPSNVPDS
jgi:hypothetical protein